MYCTNCGAKLQESSKFCTKCGSKRNDMISKKTDNSKEEKTTSTIGWIGLGLLIVYCPLVLVSLVPGFLIWLGSTVLLIIWLIRKKERNFLWWLCCVYLVLVLIIFLIGFFEGLQGG